MNTEDDNEKVKTQFPKPSKPHVAIGTIGHRPNVTLMVAMAAAMSMPMPIIMPTPKPPKQDDDSVV